MPIRNPLPQPRPEDEHARYKRQLEEETQRKVREMQEDQDRQQGKLPKKEK